MAESLPYELTELIRRCLPSMDHVELVVLVFARDESAAWTVADAAREVKSTPELTQPRIDELVAAGLVERTDTPAGIAYRLRPASAAQRRALADLRQMYSSRPVTLVRAVYERPSSAVQSFADAFRLRGKER